MGIIIIIIIVYLTTHPSSTLQPMPMRATTTHIGSTISFLFDLNLFLFTLVPAAALQHTHTDRHTHKTLLWQLWQQLRLVGGHLSSLTCNLCTFSSSAKLRALLRYRPHTRLTPRDHHHPAYRIP